MRINTLARNLRKTHEGAAAHPISPEQELRRTVLACLLWENTFYENGVDIAERIKDLVPQVEPTLVSELAIEARNKYHLRHVSLLLARELVRHHCKPMTPTPQFVETTVAGVLQRADEPAELLAMLWADNKEKKGVVPHAVRRGINRAVGFFDEYQLSKYRGGGREVKLRDVFNLAHPKPTNSDKGELWRRVVTEELSSPDTWEVALSAADGVSPHDKWTRLASEGVLGGMAVLRNLRNMQEAGVDRDVINQAILTANYRRVLPFRFIAAARAAPRYEPQIETAMFGALAEKPKLPGRTAILVDVSGSMMSPLSSKSDMNRLDAACGVAIVGRELFEEVATFTFSNNLAEIAPRRGFALRDAIVKSQPHNGTYLSASLKRMYEVLTTPAERTIIITDEQSHDGITGLPQGKGYVINVASYQNGVGYGTWTHIDGFSEAVFDYIIAMENEDGRRVGNTARMEENVQDG